MASRGVTAGLAALVLLAGCGGGDDEVPDAQAASDAVSGFTEAFAAGDGAKACSLLTSAAEAAFVKRAQAATGEKDCPSSMKKVHDLAGSSVTGPLATAKVSDVKVTGSTATATLTASGHSTTVNLSKVGDDWKLNGVPGI